MKRASASADSKGKSVHAECVTVDLGIRSYSITIEPGLIGSIAKRLPAVSKSNLVGIITDRHVAHRYLRIVQTQCKRAGFVPVPVVLPPGERTKSWATIGKILDVLAKHRFERKSLLIALGGGVVGDIAGFAASIYQRGIPFVQIPTSLVAQVDSSVGGKTGVDHRLGKNLIGAFHQPAAVWIDPDVLRTLPKREWIAGLAEVIKYGIIEDADFFAYLEEAMPKLLELDRVSVMHAIKRSCEIKAQVVAEDEQESDRRRILNYGHTIGHALESLGNYRTLIHGEAVGIGLVLEAELAQSQGYCTADTVDRIRRLVRAAGLLDRPTNRSAAKIWAAMQHDKKVSQGKVVGVWPETIGRVRMAPLDRHAFMQWFKTVPLTQDRRNRGQRRN